MMDLKNKVVLVTGASSGIGKEAAIAFAKKQSKVILTYNKTKKGGEEALEECKKYSQAVLLKLDITNENEIRKVVNEAMKEFGRIDILVNNAGIVNVKHFIKQTFKEIESEISTDLTGHIKMTSAVLPIMHKQNEGMIINVASIAGKSPSDEIVTYCAAKYGLRGFTQSLAIELPKNIKTYCVNPGYTATRMTDYEGISPGKVAEIIVKAAEEKLNKKSGDDVDIEDYVE